MPVLVPPLKSSFEGFRLAENRSSKWFIKVQNQLHPRSMTIYSRELSSSLGASMHVLQDMAQLERLIENTKFKTFLKGISK